MATSTQLPAEPNEPEPMEPEDTMPVGALRSAVSVTVAVQLVDAGSVTGAGEQITLVLVG